MIGKYPSNQKYPPREGEILLSMLSRIQRGSIEICLPNKSKILFSGTTTAIHGQITITNWKMAHMVITRGDIGAAESFVAGFWETPNLADLLTLISLNRECFEEVVYGSWIDLIKYKIKDIFRRNTRKGAKKNIHEHYDIGNKFYEIWLDETMTYSSAIFPKNTNQKTLSEAQTDKYDRIIKALGIQQQSAVLEIGCGWGGFALYCAKQRGARLDAITISDQQYRYAKKKISNEGLDKQVNVKFCDYRELRGQYDFIVSIEMFEAVGESFWRPYFETLKRNLKPGGRAIIQTIVIKDNLYHKYRETTDFIRQYVFPGGALPSPSIFKRKANLLGLEIAKEFSFGHAYATTIKHWMKRYLSNLDTLNKMGFDNNFHRLWIFYLSYCQAGFKVGDIDVVQFELFKP